MFDVVVIGGGIAGLSAALVLGRARHSTLVLDAGTSRQFASPTVHGLFSRDGISPAELHGLARLQLQPYGAVAVQKGTAVDACAIADGFEVSLASGPPVRSRRLLLAFGVSDALPPIDGLRELWGTMVLHCAYCHGWERRDQVLALYARGDSILELAGLLLGWSGTIVVCADGPAEITDEQLARLTRHGVSLREEPIRCLQGTGAGCRIKFAAGPDVLCGAMFLMPRQSHPSPLANRLRCERTAAGLIRIDGDGATSVPGVYAAGDLVSPLQQSSIAAGSGAAAAIGISRSLLAERFQ